eukprot:CAMPEP_0172429174 /NCGR_PEP_ID=MMETSP1064-20121228/49419_1 /TAXON_ID=202472 /ORGANISM="Aulacoseira subarctica , Strain CCAP 1002/5" /LENGTH=262 /DNA_ID=CAMNT_0013174415 /DNA_START=186 /DNA_END=974 /DNA_ORIENTATION=-
MVIFSSKAIAILFWSYVCSRIRNFQVIYAFGLHATIVPTSLRRQPTGQRRQRTKTRNTQHVVLPTLSTSSSGDYELLHRVSIEYCTGCKWMLRAAWISQELLTTFQDELHSVSLIPSKPPSPAGTFLIKLNDDVTVWNRKDEGRFPEAKEVKQRIRDLIRPEKSLGHSDSDNRKGAGKQVEQLSQLQQSDSAAAAVESLSTSTTATFAKTVQSFSIETYETSEETCEECEDARKKRVQEIQMQFVDIDDEDAQEMRRFYGVL